MATLVLELQKDAMDSSVALTDLLRKAFVVAKKLRITEFQRWVECELNGYSDDSEEIPPYREVTGEIRAWNPYHGWVPVIIRDENTSKKLQTAKIGQPISELEIIKKDKDGKGIFYIPLSQSVENWLMKGNRPHLKAGLHISENIIHGILDVVRNTVLDWALKLEEEGILGTGLSFTAQEKEKAQANPSINIQNFQGILGNVSSSNVSQDLKMSIQTNDFKSLAEFLKAKGVSTEDISELQKAISDDPKPESPKSLGEKVSGWIGKMISKAASGAWNIGVQAAGTVLANAISAYYGFNS